MASTPWWMWADTGWLSTASAKAALRWSWRRGWVPQASTYWAPIQQEIAGLARVCRFDRAGRGKSDPAPTTTPRTYADMVADLRALLHNASIPAPYVLVGNSVGGMNPAFGEYFERGLAEVSGYDLQPASSVLLAPPPQLLASVSAIGPNQFQSRHQGSKPHGGRSCGSIRQGHPPLTA